MHYAQKIKEQRQDAGKTQEEIAKILNTTQSYYAQYEKGKRKLPIEHLIKLCILYNVSADYLLDLPRNLPYPKRITEK